MLKKSTDALRLIRSPKAILRAIRRSSNTVHGITPVLGARTVAQIKDNLAAAELRLGDDKLARLDAASAVPLGYPHDFVRALFPFLVDDENKRL